MSRFFSCHRLHRLCQRLYGRKSLIRTHWGPEGVQITELMLFNVKHITWMTEGSDDWSSDKWLPDTQSMLSLLLLFDPRAVITRWSWAAIPNIVHFLNKLCFYCDQFSVELLIAAILLNLSRILSSFVVLVNSLHSARSAHTLAG